MKKLTILLIGLFLSIGLFAQSDSASIENYRKFLLTRKKGTLPPIVKEDQEKTFEGWKDAVYGESSISPGTFF